MTLAAPRAKNRGHSAGRTGNLSPQDGATLWDLEERFWTSGRDSASTTTAKNAMMIFPYPSGILQGGQIRDHLRRETGWRTVKMTDRSATRHGALAVLAYLVSAEKADSPIYEAVCASTYLHDDNGWLRISHEQTPIM
jgi:hypothetical protein